MGNLERLQQNLNQGLAAAKVQNWDLAAELYRKALEEMPENPITLLNLGQAYFELEKFTDAMACFTQLSILSSDDPVPFEKIAMVFERLDKMVDAAQAFIKAADIYMNQKDIEKAIDDWLRAIHIQPENFTARTRLAMVYERLGRKEEAISEYLVTSSVYQKNGNNEKAVQVIEYCLQIQPDHADASRYLDLINNNQLLPQPEKWVPSKGSSSFSLTKNNEKSAIHPSNLDPVMECRQKAVTYLSDTYMNLTSGKGSPNNGQASHSSPKTNPPVDNSNQARIHLYLSQALESLSNGNEKSSVEELEKAFNIGFQDAAAYYLHGSLSLSIKNPGASKSLMKAAESDDYALGAFLLLGQILSNQEKYTKAVGAYVNALCMADASSVPQDRFEELIQAYEPLMVMYSKQTNEEDSKRICERITNLLMDPNWRKKILQFRSQLLVEDPESPPFPLGEVLLEKNGDQLLDTLSYIQQLITQDKIPSALEEAYFAINIAPLFLPLQNLIADLLLQSGKTTEAVYKFTLLSTLYELRGQIDKSGRLLSKIIQVAPMDIKLRFRLIQFLSNQGKFKEAVQQSLSLAEIYYQLSDLEKARSTYSDAIHLMQQAKMDPSDTLIILNKMADIDMQRLDFRQATRVFEQIRVLEPDNLNTRSQLAEIYLRAGQDSAAVKEANELTSIYEKKGMREESIKFLTSMVEKKSGNLELRKLLADALVRVNRIPEAVEQLDSIANTLLDNGSVAGAATMIKAIIALNPTNVGEYQKALTQIDRL